MRLHTPNRVKNTLSKGYFVTLFVLSLLIPSGWLSISQAAQISENIAFHAVPGEMPSLDPPYMLSQDINLGFNIYETLTLWDAEKGIVPVLATSWESNSDGTEWIFRLREDVTFHDGTLLTAADVKASLDKNISVGMVAYDFIGIESIDVLDDHTVRFVASAPRNVPLIVSASYGMFIYKADAVDQPAEWWAAGNDAGTGPYTVSSFEPGTRVIIDQYPDYWGGWKEGQFTKIVYLVVEDPTVRDQMIRSGEADLTSGIPFDSVASLQGTDGVTLVPYLPLSQLMLNFDLNNPPLDNLDVRRALRFSFPYEDVHRGIFLGNGRVSAGAGPSALWNPPADFPKQKFDIEKSKALLEGAGFGDGFELNLAISTGSKETSDAVRLWQSELSKINVSLNIRQLSGGAFWGAAFNPDNEEFDVFVVAASGDVPSPYAWLIIYTSSPYGWFPVVGHKNPEFDKLVFDAWALEASDTEKANSLWVDAQRILHDDAISIFAMDAPIMFAHGDDIQGLVLVPPYAGVVFWYNMTRSK
ncbi:MAG: ABC transporter substrate-binding protein [Chloroflexota bacterium]|nr:ABC transporter substrate-binding protein [Chloroflexota bacterium]